MSKKVREMIAATAILVFALMGLAFAAQQDKPMKEQQDKPMKDMPGQDSTTSQNTTINPADKKFVEEAAEGGMMEVKLGRLAVERASSEDVKQFGQRMIDDHSKANTELQQLAAQKGIDIPKMEDDTSMMHDEDETVADTSHDKVAPTDQSGQMSKPAKDQSGRVHEDMHNSTQEGMMDKKHQETIDKLSNLSGAEFDREYMALMVKDHTKDVSEFEKEARNAKDPDIKMFAEKTLPTLREHLQMAHDINGKVSGKTTKTSSR